MGGRGASLGLHIEGKNEPNVYYYYSTEYETIHSVKNIKFVIALPHGLNDEIKSTKSPKETRTRGRVYVTVNNKGALKTITYYDRNGIRKKEIGISDKDHQGGYHVHIGANHNENGGVRKPNAKEVKMIERVIQEWDKYKNNMRL